MKYTLPDGQVIDIKDPSKMSSEQRSRFYQTLQKHYPDADPYEADLRKGRRSDRMMAINMQLEWEKMENLRSSYEAAGKLEIWKAAYAAFTEQMQTPSMGKDLHSVDDFLYFFEFGEFPEKSLSPADAVAAAGQ